jgi:hypothetical protein
MYIWTYSGNPRGRMLCPRSSPQSVCGGDFCLHPHPHGDKIFVFGAPNGAIPTEIRSTGYKLTTLITGFTLDVLNHAKTMFIVEWFRMVLIQNIFAVE